MMLSAVGDHLTACHSDGSVYYDGVSPITEYAEVVEPR